MTARRTWRIRTADGGATGIEVANARLSASHDLVLAHALPGRVTVEVHDGGSLVAAGEDLHDGETLPIAELEVDGVRVMRRNVWPTDEHLGLPLILPGGEAGILRSWWNDDERSSWRWTVEFTNGPRFEGREEQATSTATNGRGGR